MFSLHLMPTAESITTFFAFVDQKACKAAKKHEDLVPH